MVVVVALLAGEVGEVARASSCGPARVAVGELGRDGDSSPCPTSIGTTVAYDRVRRAHLGVDEGVDEVRLALLELADDGDGDAGAADLLAAARSRDDRSVRPRARRS